MGAQFCSFFSFGKKIFFVIFLVLLAENVHLNIMTGQLPLELRYNVYNLMKQKTHNANRESNNAHHEPSETHGNLGGFTKSMVISTTLYLFFFHIKDNNKT